MKKQIFIGAILLAAFWGATATSTAKADCPPNCPVENNTSTSGTTHNNTATSGTTHNNSTSSTQSSSSSSASTSTNGSDGAASSSGNGCQIDDTSTTFCNPLPQNNVKDFVINLIKTIITIIGVVAVAMIVYGGFRMVVSAGNDEGVKGARKIITNAVLGVVVAGLAYTIIAVIDTILSK